MLIAAFFVVVPRMVRAEERDLPLLRGSLPRFS